MRSLSTILLVIYLLQKDEWRIGAIQALMIKRVCHRDCVIIKRFLIPFIRTT
jgi:hypothetical protein